MVRRLIPDYDFIMDVDDSFIDNFVNVPSGIPNLLMDFLEKRDNDVTHKRFLTFYNNPEYESLDQDERAVTHRLLKEDKFDEALECFNQAINLEKNNIEDVNDIIGCVK